MKTDINVILNKLVCYAQDNLMLDSLDSTYALNRLAALAGVTPAAVETDYGDKTLSELLAELKAACPAVDERAAVDVLMPLPHTVNYYFNDQLGRNSKKAFDFIFELFSMTGDASDAPAGGANGYTRYTAGKGTRAIMLAVGDGDVKYSPISTGGAVAKISSSDFMSEDIALREVNFAEQYKMAIARRLGGDGDYYACEKTALSSAPVKKKLTDGVVKASLLDYPVPAISLTGPKNSVCREAIRMIHAVGEENLPCVCACESGQWTTFYFVFANDVPGSDVLCEATPLTACGVFSTINLSPLVATLEKGTALASDLFMFKSLYSEIGGVKHGAKAAAVADGELVKQFAAALKAASSADEDKVCALVAAD